ncbi:MAG: Lipid-A-disaccharide synthase [Chlamydiia bacterium]|nr:Lipid-A-disaccharide synthase [Chlamydiia bacterium]
MKRKSQLDFFIFAGEESGDTLGSHLVENLLKKSPSLKIAGVGGKKMRKKGFYALMRTESFLTMGFLDVFFVLPKLIYYLFKVRRMIQRLNPKVVVLIDYTEFNLQLAKRLRKKGYKGQIVQYVCPSIWAWRKKRKKTMEKHLDGVFCLFPFEKECFSKSSLSAFFVGHPLKHKIATTKPTPDFFAQYPTLSDQKPIIAIFPGSRQSIVERNLPIQLEALANHPQFGKFQIAISAANPKLARKVQELATTDYTLIANEDNYSLMHHAHIAICSSGTIALELACNQLPTIVTYSLPKLDLFLAKHIFKIILPHYCIANIVYGETVFPEFYGPNLTVESLTKAIDHLLTNPDERQVCIDKCQAINRLLSQPAEGQGASNLLMRHYLSTP